MVDSKKIAAIVFGVLLIAGMIYVLLNSPSTATGKIILDLNSKYQSGKALNGTLKVSLNQGEFLPYDSKIVFENNGQTYEYNLSDLISQDPLNGSFYIAGSSLSGNGKGIGYEGEKTIHPNVDFTLEISSQNSVPETTPGTNTNENASSNSNTSSNKSTNNETNPNNQNNTQTTENQSSDSGNVNPAENNSGSNTETTQSTNKTPVSTNPPETSSSSSSTENTQTQTESSTTTTEQTTPTSNENTNTGTESASSTTTPSSNTGTSQETSTTTETSTSSGTETTQQSTGSGSETTGSSSSSSGESGQTAPSSSTETSASTSGSGSENTAAQAVGGVLTGQVVLSTQRQIHGIVSSGNNFVYDLNPGETASIVPGSVSSDSKNIDESNVNLVVKGNQAIVSTDYSKTTKGFGKDYLGSKTEDLIINLSKFKTQFQNGSLNISVVYNNNKIISLNTFLEENKTISAQNKSSEIINNSLENNTIQETNISINTENISLSSEEKSILLDNLGNQSVKITKAERTSQDVVVRFELGKYWVEHHYDSNLSDSEIKALAEQDRIKFLKDLAEKFSENNSGNSTEVKGLIGNYQIQ